MKNALKHFYYKFGSHVVVTKKSLDASGEETTDSTLVVKLVYTIINPRHMKGVTSPQHSIAKVNTKASFVITCPEAGGKVSGAPVQGYFIFSCLDPVTKLKLSTD